MSAHQAGGDGEIVGEGEFAEEEVGGGTVGANEINRFVPDAGGGGGAAIGEAPGELDLLFRKRSGGSENSVDGEVRKRRAIDREMDEAGVVGFGAFGIGAEGVGDDRDGIFAVVELIGERESERLGAIVGCVGGERSCASDIREREAGV